LRAGSGAPPRFPDDRWPRPRDRLGLDARIRFVTGDDLLLDRGVQHALDIGQCFFIDADQ
jgi:hypothetical protein